ncbi:MAG: carboxylate--amine ligase [Actinobacteria bacterium RBG_19FT_COMBO_54_7]|uniref:Carboxylate--amine ligase n=1 Tax=Candidatus Solincola sediminis TaxID=1797199 RepID=A0A1F2WKI7_9ACTN|nr:MAG: carboxylate--amine ligase [Candidatus Solincola sediminis]OFW57343.1 MAG: carboxylate--amine ligase [Candidatus Solincola sediminis]OFW70338.1 MAG: carboxylate--amine ligase [Actinobacteria bacterium RBG_19FT_COMBO_54_7]
MDIVKEAVDKGQKALSEFQAKLFLSEHEVPVTREKLVVGEDEAIKAAEEIGYPVVLKANGPNIAHKTERNLVKVGLDSAEQIREAYKEIVENLGSESYDGILVQQMVKGERELVVGLVRDPQFGPCVMFGLGGIFTEVLKDTSFRVAPIEKYDAMQMMDEIKSKAILGPFRGKPPVDRDKLAEILIAVGNIGMEYDAVREIDINPLIIAGAEPVAVDALVVLGDGTK